MEIPYETLVNWHKRGIITHTYVTESGRYMFHPKLKDFYYGNEEFQYTNFDSVVRLLEEEIKYIEGTVKHYVSNKGNIYMEMSTGILKRKKLNKVAGYYYCGITYKDGEKSYNISKRVHRLVAYYFCKNKENLQIVGHKDNDKTNNHYTNLYWTTISENTKKAVVDGLLVNDIGIEDSQSIPIAMYKNSGELIGVYGSISEASRCIEGFGKSSIAKNLDRVKKGIKGYYFKSISKQFYLENSEIQKVKTKVPVMSKKRRKFKIYDMKMNFLEYSDNQKETALKYGVNQARISSVLRGKTPNNDVEGKIKVELVK